MFWNRKKIVAAEPPDEPLFRAVRTDDQQMIDAHARAAASVDEFVRHINAEDGRICAAKLRFRDPGLSEELGEDRFLYLWLTSAQHDPGTGLFTADFFEVPAALAQWHQAGEQLEFEGDAIFDWFANDDGHLYGGFTLRVTRGQLPEDEKPAFDRHVGVRCWMPLEMP